jgi:hypothetical protein
MRSYSPPASLPANNRIQPQETTVYSIDATLTEYKLETDSDYHLIIQDGSGSTMITEIPDPACASGSLFLASIQSARGEFDAKFTATGSFKATSVPVRVRGIGFFDFLHGQTGVAPNGIELHPVLDIQFSPPPMVPTVDSLSPNSGPSAGGTLVTLSGTNFTAVSAVAFGAAPAASYSINSSTQIMATSPPGSGVVDVTVTGPTGTSATSAADKFAYTSPPVAYTAQNPIRILDTRNGTGGTSAPLGPGGSLNLTVAAPAGATGVVLNVTVTNTTAASFLKVTPAGAAPATVSNLNWAAGETKANLVNVPIGSGNQVTITNGVGSVDVIADEGGYFAPPSGNAGGYNALPPQRLLDTRNGTGGCSTMSTGSICDLQILGAGGVPTSGVSAVVLNATATNTSTQGFFTLYPSLTPKATVSNLNWAAGWTLPNRVIVGVGSNGKVSIYNGQGSADAVVDVSGYFTDSTLAGKFFTPLTPARVLDTRNVGGTIGPNATYSNFQITGKNGVPAGATAVFLNTTVANTTASSALTVFPGPTRPTASDLNWVGGQTIPNLTLATLSSTGTTSFYNFVGSTDLVLDLSGYFS